MNRVRERLYMDLDLGKIRNQSGKRLNRSRRRSNLLE